MPIFKTNKTTFVTHALYEDPRPAGNRLYVWGEAHSRDTLEYQLTDGFNHNVAKTGITGYGFPALAYSSIRYDGVLLLTGETVHCLHITTNNNSDDNTLDFKHMLSMDPNNQIRNHRFVTYGPDSAVVNIHNHMVYNNANPAMYYEVFYNSGAQKLDLATISQSSSIAYRQTWMNNIRNSTGYIQCITQASGSTRTAYPQTWGPGRIRNFLGGSGFTVENSTLYNSQMIQRIGDSTAGLGLFLLNNVSNDHTQTIIRYDDSANAITTIQTINAVPYPSAGASGANTTSTGWLLPGTTTTNMGGARSFTVTTTNIKVSSQTFVDPSTSTGRAWYTPFFDLGVTYQPFYYQWNTATDLFSRSNDMIVDWRGTGTQWAATATQWHYFLPDNVSGGTLDQTYQLSRPIWNETWTVTAGSTTTRYLMLMQLHGNGVAYDNNHLLRTFVTFQVDAVNPKYLVRHSQLIIPYTPKNVIWLNAEHTLIGVFGLNQFNIYSFNQDTGWGLTVQLNNRFDAVGLDAFNRIWAVEPGPFGGYGRLHLLSSAVPSNLTINLFEPSYNFTGTNINTTATVSAYDQSGNRIAANVTLSIEGTSMRFINTLSQQVASLSTITSVSTGVDVSVVIVGSGISYINGSVTI